MAPKLPRQRWKIKEADRVQIEELVEKTGLSPLLAQVLIHRDIANAELAQVYNGICRFSHQCGIAKRRDRESRQNCHLWGLRCGWNDKYGPIVAGITPFRGKCGLCHSEPYEGWLRD